MTTHTDAKRSNAYTRASLRRKTIERVGEDTLTLSFEPEESDDGQPHTFHIPHPFFYDKATKDALALIEDLEKGETPEGYDEERWGPFRDDEYRARVLLGEAQYDEFTAAGGTADEIGHLTLNANLDTRDNLADGTPTRR